MRNQLLKSFATLGIVLASAVIPTAAQYYKVNNILSDGSVPALVTDPNFINPWAISSSGTWWISTASTGFNYVVSSTANTIAFKVIVPAASNGTSAGFPAGSVTTGGAVGMILPNATKASFLFSTLDGTISGWNSKLGTANAISQIAINNSATGAVYPGLAILNVQTAGATSASYILAPNFGTASKIEVYDSTFKPASLTGTFTDPNLPAGYSPFAIHIIGSQIFVAYALKSATTANHIAAGSGNGVVDIFDLNGNFVSRAIAAGNLNAPWGVAIAPANFGIYSNDLLIGNFGDGIINVYDPKTFAYLGQLMDVAGKPVTNLSLWELLPGGTAVAGTTAVSGGDPTTVYFTAGLAAEKHGLFGNIANTTTAGSTPTFALSASTGTAAVTAGNSATASIVMAPTNGFNGTVTLGCSGVPTGAICTFSPAQVTVSPTAPVTSTLTISTSKATGSLRPLRLGGNVAGEVATAFLFPLASLLIFRRRRSVGNAITSLRLFSVLLLTLFAGTMVIGCSDNSTFSLPATPAGTSTILVTATAGAVTQQTSIALTVN